MMKVAVLYRKPDDEGKEYPFDNQGRGSLTHVMRIKDSLQAQGHIPQLVNFNLDSFEYLRATDFDLVFNLCDDGFRNDSLLEAHIPAMLDILQIPYTGSNFFTLASCVDKARTKEILTFHNIPTPEFQVFYRSNGKLNTSLDFPLIVKPLHEDASIGLKNESVVNSPEQLQQRVEVVLNAYSQPALVEKFISGKELYVGILGSAEKLKVLPITEIVFDSALPQSEQICSYEAKWVTESEAYKNTPVKCPAELDRDLEQELIEIAKEAYILMSCQDYGRVDFRVDQNNQPYVLEVNPNPDISEDAGLSRMIRAAGMSYDQLISEILDSALRRNRNSKEKAR